MQHLIQTWLSLQCSMISGATKAVVITGPSDKGLFTKDALWPLNSTDPSALIAAAEAVTQEKRCVVRKRDLTVNETGDPLDILACPLFSEGQMTGAVAIEMFSRPQAQQKSAMLQLQGGATWLEAMIHQQASTAKEQLVAVMELVAASLEHNDFKSAATDVVTDLATRYSCDRVSIGFLHGRNLQVDAVSHSAQFDDRSNLIRDIALCMHEAIDQENTIVYPAFTDDHILVHRAHTTLIKEYGAGMVCTIPLVCKGEMSGALMLERSPDEPFDEQTIQECEQIASLIGPVLEIRRRDDRVLRRKAADTLQSVTSRIFGPKKLALKCVTALCAVLLGVLCLTTQVYRVSSTASLEASILQAVVAPQNGFIADASVRAGDIVRSGELLCSLKDKDLRLEYQKWFSQREQLRKEHRVSLASHERAKINIVKAQIDQAEAQLDLVKEQLLRTKLTAPFDGIVVSGDLSQALGSPIERGQILFEIAPLKDYRVIVEVDERDIREIKTGQQGHIMLSSMPNKPFPLVVEKITPISTTEAGRNYFRVEAKMEIKSDLFRPGMEGVAKIQIDRRKNIWIWTHNLVDWFRLFVWRWTA